MLGQSSLLRNREHRGLARHGISGRPAIPAKEGDPPLPPSLPQCHPPLPGGTPPCPAPAGIMGRPARFLRWWRTGAGLLTCWCRGVPGGPPHPQGRGVQMKKTGRGRGVGIEPPSSKTDSPAVFADRHQGPAAGATAGRAHPELSKGVPRSPRGGGVHVQPPPGAWEGLAGPVSMGMGGLPEDPPPVFFRTRRNPPTCMGGDRPGTPPAIAGISEPVKSCAGNAFSLNIL